VTVDLGKPVRVPPRGTITVSWSEIDTARQCPFKHDLSYIERWSKPPRADGALAKGTLWHLVLEAHYRSLQATQADKPGGKPKASPLERAELAQLAALEVMRRAEEDAGKDQAALGTVELIRWMYEGYLDMYEIDSGWHVMGVEHELLVRLPLPSGRASRFLLKGKIDLIVLVQTLGRWRLVIIDHKSGKDLPRSKQLDFNDQFGLYVWWMRRTGRNVFQVIHDAARTQRNKDSSIVGQPLDTRFLRTPMYRTDDELRVLAVEAYQTINARYRQQIECDRAGIEPPRHTDEDRCGWRCDFTDPCLHGRKTSRPQLIEYLQGAGFVQNFERH
jgi:hypothetical protein